VGLRESDVRVVNTSDADIVAAYATPGVTATVTWKPLLSEVLANQNSALVFDSSKTPGEILDLMVVNTKVLEENPELGKALVGAWYEIMAVMQAEGAEATAALTSMATASGTDLDGFNSQLATTHMYWQPADAVAAVTSADLAGKMDLVRRFSFEKGLLGEGAESVDVVGIEFPGGNTLGNPANITMRFDATYMQMAAEGTL
jgi:NitT/TauT family transport system substrate-binding protein